MGFVSLSACSGTVKFMAQVQASLLLSPVFRLVKGIRTVSVCACMHSLQCVFVCASLPDLFPAAPCLLINGFLHKPLPNAKLVYVCVRACVFTVLVNRLPSNVGFGMKCSTSATSPLPNPFLLLPFIFTSVLHFFPLTVSPFRRPSYSLPIISPQLFQLKLPVTSKIDRCGSYAQPHPAHTNTAAFGFISGTLQLSPIFHVIQMHQSRSGIPVYFFVSLQCYLNGFPLCIYSIAQLHTRQNV